MKSGSFCYALNCTRVRQSGAAQGIQLELHDLARRSVSRTELFQRQLVGSAGVFVLVLRGQQIAATIGVEPGERRRNVAGD